MAQKYEEWMAVWRAAAAHRDLSYIIGHLKEVNAAFGPVDIYELKGGGKRAGKEVPPRDFYPLVSI